MRMDPNTVPAGVAPDYLAAYGQLVQELWLPILLLAVWAYFCGCFNGAVIVSKYILRDDVRTHGSGNAGLTNFFRTFGVSSLSAGGRTMCAPTLFCGAAKTCSPCRGSGGRCSPGAYTGSTPR